MEQLARQQAVERERARIAKDIHDDLGAKSDADRRAGRPGQAGEGRERIEKMASTARQAVKSLDEIVWAVNPRNDTLAHLIDYTGQFAADYLRAAGVRCLLDVSENARSAKFPAPCATIFFWWSRKRCKTSSNTPARPKYGCGQRHPGPAHCDRGQRRRL
jgi:signal transduction histidine kinase